MPIFQKQCHCSLLPSFLAAPTLIFSWEYLRVKVLPCGGAKIWLHCLIDCKTRRDLEGGNLIRFLYLLRHCFFSCRFVYEACMLFYTVTGVEKDTGYIRYRITLRYPSLEKWKIGIWSGDWIKIFYVKFCTRPTLVSRLAICENAHKLRSVRCEDDLFRACKTRLFLPNTHIPQKQVTKLKYVDTLFE